VTDLPALSYVLPLRWEQAQGRLDELTSYLSDLSKRCQLIVVDGSPPAAFDRHAHAWSGIAQHCPPDPDQRFLNGKVNGVVTGVRRAVAEAVVIADDDVRYDLNGLGAVAAALQHADLVIPQNVFSSWPWHARWDTARSLLNRSCGADYPGTLAIRRSTFERCGGYDGGVLFENLELIRTVAAHGARCAQRPNCSSAGCRRPRPGSGRNGYGRPMTASPSRHAWSQSWHCCLLCRSWHGAPAPADRPLLP